MRVGVVILPDRPWAQARRLWEKAETVGFAHAWTYDHLGWRDLVDGPWFDSIATLTAAAGVTGHIKLGTMVASPHFRHPAHFAREITTLDDVSGGRAVIGVGAGGLAGFDNDVLGQPRLDRRQRFERFAEFVELLHRLLREGRVTYDGAYYRAVDARCEVSELPLVIAAEGPRGIKLAQKYGDAWLAGGDVTEDVEEWWSSVERLSERNPINTTRFLILDPRSAVYSLSSVEYFVDTVERAERLGFTDVVTHWPRESGWFAGDEAVLDEAMAELRLRGLLSS
ncbi:MAG: LLM class flavin-dependent oxidoreductase [Hamadaea sp.]|uniref:LLM class flavin-dependent oxidoreductase n=1 Tax=Hamadaea sp. TaxID=2024425 RepID=UPI00185A0BB0|nr:LLM class flavin-dependent oxidoreductase [Hamadaea sp.]NUT20950.1 LLM class flavin-dependent oxidoreductase [Hamadaea sp.]